jgi:hypothetical protein
MSRDANKTEEQEHLPAQHPDLTRRTKFTPKIVAAIEKDMFRAMLDENSG